MSNINYKNECQVYLRLIAQGQKITQADFCETRSKELGEPVSLGYFKKLLGKLRINFQATQCQKGVQVTQNVTMTQPREGQTDWDQLKAEFMVGDYRSVSDFARQRGIKVHPSFRRRTKGWKAEKAKICSASESQTVSNLVDSRVTEKMQKLHTEALSIELKLFDILKEIVANRSEWPEIKNPYAAREVVRFALDMVKALREILTDISGLKKLSEINQIFADLSEGKTDVTRACLALAQMGVRLPKVLEVMLAKQPVEEATPEEGEMITEEQILARRKEILEEIEQQRQTFVPERVAYVNQLKQEMKDKDSFGAQANEDGDSVH